MRLLGVLMLPVLLVCGSSAFAQGQAYIVVQQSMLAGFRHYEGPRIWNELRVGDPLALVREAGNPHDPHAVRVEWRGRTVGYVARRENRHLARQIDAGAALHGRITDLHRARNGRNRVAYEIVVPLK